MLSLGMDHFFGQSVEYFFLYFGSSSSSMRALARAWIASSWIASNSFRRHSIMS